MKRIIFPLSVTVVMTLPAIAFVSTAWASGSGTGQGVFSKAKDETQNTSPKGEVARAENSCEILLANQPRIADQASVRWMRTENGKTSLRIKESENKAAIEEFLGQIYDRPTVTQREDLGQGLELQLVDQGVAKGESLVLMDTKTKKGQPLLESTDLKKNQSIHFIRFKLSPKKNRVALSFEENGSLDEFQTLIFDLEAKNYFLVDFLSADGNVAWKNAETIVTQGYSLNSDGTAGVPTILSYELNSNRKDETPGFVSVGQKDWFLTSSGKKIQLRHANGYATDLAGPLASPREIIGQIGKKVFFVSDGDSEMGQVDYFDFGDKSGKPTNLIHESSWLLVSATVVSNSIVADYRKGAQHRLIVTDEKGLKLASLDAPECCSMKVTGWKTQGKVLEVTLSSNLVGSANATYDVEKKAWGPDGIIDSMLEDAGIKFVSEIVSYASEDGTQIPMRVTRRADLKATGDSPVLIAVYGGFNLTGSIDPKPNKMNLQFIKDGGIVAAPAVRGGNEFGPDWHSAATKGNKIKTMQDLASASRFLVKAGWTTAKKVAAVGTSNGGFVVASAGLLFPNDFGLMIPISGVLNLEKFNIYDAQFARGWKKEYGDVSDAQARQSILQVSPVELMKKKGASNDLPRFFVIAGENDSRVNPMHSHDFVRAARGQQQNDARVELADIKNSGHWLGSVAYQNLIGWRTSVLQWATIYDFMGLKLPKNGTELN